MGQWERMLAVQNETIISSLTERSHNYSNSRNQEKASAILPKAQLVLELAKPVLEQLRTLEQSAVRDGIGQSGIDTVLEKLNNRWLSDDPEALAVFHHFNFADGSFSSTRLPDYSGFFGSATFPDSIISMQLRLNILAHANRLLSFYHLRAASWTGGHDWPFAFVGLSSSVVNPGESITVDMGIGIFSNASKPEFRVNGKLVTAKGNDMTRLALKAQSKPGAYSIVVNCSYVNEDGIRMTVERIAKYRVVSCVKDSTEKN
jgi:hypothetical protein